MKWKRRWAGFRDRGGERDRRRELSATYYKALTDWITAAEERTSAELIVVIRGQSGQYRDIDYLVGAFTAWIGLWLVLFLPWSFLVYSIPFELALCFLVGSWFSPRTPLRYWLTRRKRRHRQVKLGATAALLNESVLLTRDHTGVLIYWSWFEHEVEIMADVGVLRAVPPEKWNECVFHFRHLDREKDQQAAFLADLKPLEDVLATFLPPKSDNPNELPNRPRIYL